MVLASAGVVQDLQAFLSDNSLSEISVLLSSDGQDRVLHTSSGSHLFGPVFGRNRTFEYAAPYCWALARYDQATDNWMSCIRIH